MNDARTILRAAREMKSRATHHKAAGEPTCLRPEVVLELAAFLQRCGNDLQAAGRYGATDEPGATETAHDIARTYFGETA